MSLDEQIRVAIDRALTDMRARLDGALRTLAQTIATAASSSEKRLADAIRSFDEATSLGDVLRLLGDASIRYADRSAVLIVASERLEGWHSSGFSGMAADASAVDLALGDSGLVGTAVGTKATVVSLAADRRTAASELPAFAQGAGERDAAAVPLVLGGTAAAVVYADKPTSGDAPASWVESVELLARYAALLLEARTARYLTGSLESSAQGTLVGDRQALEEAR